MLFDGSQNALRVGIEYEILERDRYYSVGYGLSGDGKNINHDSAVVIYIAG
jgi:hypothetical protein